MADTSGPLIGDINRRKFNPSDPSSHLSNAPGGYFNWASDYLTEDGTLIDNQGGSFWGEIYGEEGFHDNVNPNTPLVDFGAFGYDQHQAQDIINNPAFAMFYQNFFDAGSHNENPVRWWSDYGKYLTPYSSAKETLAARKGGIQKEGLRKEALQTIDKMGGFAGKRGFAGDSGMERAQQAIIEDTIRQNELQTLGVNQSLWDIRDNYMSNLYSEFGNLAGVGAFEGMGE
tara:strand:- start:16960 stop:17646 length:687 start_codon:yes stop_codon:yes gene_type:complete